MHLDHAPPRLDDALRHGETKSAEATGARREVRVESLIRHVCGDGAPRVAHQQDDVASGGDARMLARVPLVDVPLPRLDADHAVAFERRDGMPDDVLEDLREPLGIRLDGGDVRGERDAQRDAIGQERA